jgi:hypothetical protein
VYSIFLRNKILYSFERVNAFALPPHLYDNLYSCVIDGKKRRMDEEAFQRLQITENSEEDGKRKRKSAGPGFKEEYEMLEAARMRQRDERARERKEKLERLWRENGYVSLKLGLEDVEVDSLDGYVPFIEYCVAIHLLSTYIKNLRK